MIENKINLTGMRFGRWTVLQPSPSRYKNSTGTMWLCSCDCGTVRAVNGQALRTGRTKSCGCLRTDISKLNKEAKRDGKVFLLIGNELRDIEEWADISGTDSTTILQNLIAGNLPREAVFTEPTVQNEETDSKEQPEKTMARDYIKTKIKEAGLKNWQIAEALGTSDSAFSRMLRHPMAEERIALIEKIIDEVKEKSHP